MVDQQYFYFKAQLANYMQGAPCLPSLKLANRCERVQEISVNIIKNRDDTNLHAY